MMVEVDWSHTIHLAVQPVSASLARNFVRRHLLAHGLPAVSDDVVLVVSELATNALVHARTPFTVSIRRFEQTVILIVEDGSRDRPALIAHEMTDTSGRGLAIVTLLSAAWGADEHHDGRKSVWAEFDLR